MNRLLTLDFDGVICDGLAECALVAWLGVHPQGRASSGREQLAGVPWKFIERFRTVRNFSRTLDHFVVAHHRSADAFASQEEFDGYFASLPEEYVARFTAAAGQARQWLRRTDPEFWLGLHTLYPRIAQVLRRNAGATAIVTAKDEDSVWALLERHGLADTVTEVVGECARKAEAVAQVARRADTALGEVTFIDDNLANVRRVAAIGARARWALWGYHTPEHLKEATESGVVALKLADLARYAA